MSDDESDDRYPLEWLLDAPEPLDAGDELDPRHPEFLGPWGPTPGERALVDDLALQYVAGTVDFNRMFLDFSRDRYRDRSWPQAMLALLEQLKQTAIGSQGLDLTVKRLAGDVKTAREQAAEEAAQ